MTLHDYLRVLRERWKPLLAGVLLGVVASAALTWTATPLYAASVTVFVSAGDASGDAAQAYQGNLLSQQKVKSYTQLVTGSRIERELAGRGVTLAPGAVAASVQTGTVLMTITVSDPDPEQAQRAANGVADAFAALVAELERPADGGAPAVSARIVEPAELPTATVSPRPVTNLALGAALGLLLGLGAALARHALDTSIKSPDALGVLVGAPSLGSIAFDASVVDRPLVVHELPGSPRSEALRQIRTNLQFVDVDRPARTVVITSSLPGEGKTTTACNLAITLAETGATVALVDADLRRPKVGEYLGLERGVGLTSVLIDRATLDQALQPWGRGGMAVLTSGPTPPNPSELLASQHMTGMLDELTRRFDIVLIDAPPLLPVTDAVVLGSVCDGALLVVRHGRTSRHQVTMGSDALRAVSAKILGTILNMVPRSKSSESYQYYNSYEPSTGLPLPDTTWSGPPVAHDGRPLASERRHNGSNGRSAAGRGAGPGMGQGMGHHGADA